MPAAPSASDVLAGLQQREAAHRQRRQHIGQRIELVDAQRFEIVAERGFDGALPAALHAELRREPRLAAPGRCR